MYHLIMGTAGHIDHGKTALIHALTGTETDRLPEEKKRGITIELGYAQLELAPYQLGIVDVPGHERFVRQMLAGATGMDLAMLIVAADDSVKQQTIEHLDILQMLNLKTGIIVITKADLVETEWLELVEAEVQELVQGTFLQDAPIIPCSAKTGIGIDRIKQALRDACRQAITQIDPCFDETQEGEQAESSSPEPGDPTAARGFFRMAIDRTFSIAGYGTVVTGSVSSGRINVGDSVEILPIGKTVRVRGLQNHDQTVSSVSRGQRAAINLAGVGLNEFTRGQEIASAGKLLPSQIMIVKLDMLYRSQVTLKNRSPIRLHLGTDEIHGHVQLFQREFLDAGETAMAQLILSTPAVAVWGQPFVLRQPSPVVTLGGGRILHPCSRQLKKLTESETDLLLQLESDHPEVRGAASIYFSSRDSWQPEALFQEAGIDDQTTLCQRLIENGTVMSIPLSTSRQQWLHRQTLDNVAQRLIKVLQRWHQQHPLRFHHPRTSLEQEFGYLGSGANRLLNTVIDGLKQAKRIEANVNSIALVGQGPQLTKAQRGLLQDLVNRFRQNPLQEPLVGELEKEYPKFKHDLLKLLELAAANNDLVRVSVDLFLHTATLEMVQAKLVSAFGEQTELTVSDIRQLLDTSRKYAVPICEFLDQTGFTIREGDVRKLGAK